MSIGKLDSQSKLTKQREQKEELELSGQYAGPQPSPARRTNKPTTQVFASQNLHALLKAIFATYAADLRHRYKGHVIRNGAVFDSAIRECSRLGYIELVNSRKEVAGVPALIARRLKRVKHFPIWIMGPNFPDEPMNLLDQLRPAMEDDKVIWHHHPSRRKPTWRNGG
jgi:hypothetical protein